MNMGLGAQSTAFNQNMANAQFNQQNQGNWANAVGNAFGGGAGINWGQIGSLFGNQPTATTGGNQNQYSLYGP
jgi:hypothetical protein